MLRFDKVSNNVEIDSVEEYVVPEQATHFGLRNGKIAFFMSPNGEDLYKSSRHWFFIRIPEGAKALTFPDFVRSNKGWDYGIASARNYKRIDG